MRTSPRDSWLLSARAVAISLTVVDINIDVVGSTPVSDAETLAMVRQTAHDVFTDAPTPGQLADLGWYGLFTPEHLGGSGWRPREACIIAEEAGAAYSAGSWVEIALAASALAVSPESGLLDAVLSGETSASFCTGRITLGAGPGPRVSGAFPFSAGLPAQVIVVTDEDGSVGATVHGHEGVTLDEQKGCLDTTRSFHCLRLRDADAAPIDASELGWLTTTAQLLSCADTIGAMQTRHCRRHEPPPRAAGVRLLARVVPGDPTPTGRPRGPARKCPSPRAARRRGRRGKE